MLILPFSGLGTEEAMLALRTEAHYREKLGPNPPIHYSPECVKYELCKVHQCEDQPKA